MKEKDTFKRCVDILTLVIIAGGLAIGIDQAYEIRKSIDTANASTNFSTWNAVAQQWLDMDAIFIEHPDLRKYIFDGAAAPADQKEFERANAVANKVLDFIDNAVTIEAYTKGKDVQSKGFENILSQDVWDNYFGEMFSNSPMICDILKKHPSSYFPKTVEIGKKKCV